MCPFCGHSSVCVLCYDETLHVTISIILNALSGVLSDSKKPVYFPKTVNPLTLFFFITQDLNK